MSYLSFPRLHFAGQFQADTSSVNNDPAHFDDGAFQPNYQDWGKGGTNGWWNPHGTAYWRFRNCRVTRVCYADMSHCDDSHSDPIVGQLLNETNDKVSGKLVDLDPEQQMVSQIWGFQVHVGDIGIERDQPRGIGFKGNFEVTPFAEIWGRYPQGHPDSNFSAFYQSILSNVVWSQPQDSRFLTELYEISGGASELSIKFTVDSMQQDRTANDFTLGRVIGTIGLYEPGEPLNFVAERCLNPVGGSAAVSALVNSAPCRIDRERSLLLLDLGNSLASARLNGPPSDQLGELKVALKPADVRAPFDYVGAVDYHGADWLAKSAGIVAFELTPAQLEKAACTPIAVTATTPDPKSGKMVETIVLAENAQGAFLRADNFVYRIEAGEESAPITLYATCFGEPAQDEILSLSFNNAPMQGQQIQGVGVGPLPATPIDILQARIPERYAHRAAEPGLQVLAPMMKTDAEGKATFTLHAGDPGNPRQYIDGQVYGISYNWAKATALNSNNFVSVLVFDAYDCPRLPTWDDHVRPILQQYANLYPVMKDVLDLGNYESVLNHAQALKLVFNLPVEDPNYMPVTRDLSAPKRKMLLQWLDNPVKHRGHEACRPTTDHARPGHPDYEPISPRDLSIHSHAQLQHALQQAIELEHATIPPYLTALYSIVAGKNQEAAQIIRSVVMEEMLHMALACNLLNAIGGSPQINTPHFVPDYRTGKLPGGVAPNLRVHLRKCSKQQIKEVFMAIEEPGDVVYPIPEESKHTIGAFYDQIRHALVYLEEELGHRALFCGDPSRQLRRWHSTGEIIVVENLETALQAIDEIVEQGEGASPINPDDGYDELSHYYKFAEIYYGRRLVLRPGQNPPFEYSGDPIELDEVHGVYPMRDNPDVGTLTKPDQAQVRMWTEEFNRSYGNLLNALHETFNGNTQQLHAAIGLMFSLEIQAKKLMRMAVEPGATETAGPSFQIPG